MEPLHIAILDAVDAEFMALGNRTKGVAKRIVMEKVARYLELPFEHCTPDVCNHDDCMILPRDIVNALEDAWHRIDTVCDRRVSSQDRRVRLRFEADKPHFRTVDLVKFIAILFRKNSIVGTSNDRTEKILKDKRLNAILTVDGFAGLFPSDFKNYIHYLKSDQRRSYHVLGVTRMYEALSEELTGTDAASLVFLALCKLYLRRTPYADDQTSLMVDRAVRYVHCLLKKSTHYYGVLETILGRQKKFEENLIHIYTQSYDEDEASLNRTAVEKLSELCMGNKFFWRGYSQYNLIDPIRIRHLEKRIRSQT